LKIIFSTIQHCLLEKVPKRNLLEHKQEIRDFIRMKLGIRHRETYMLIFLDARNQLIDYSIITEGTVDYVINYARNIVEATVDKNASKVIMVHNHPSGVCTPSQEDINSTYKIYAALNSIDVELSDHIIVCTDEIFSFADHQLSLKG
jgi:DNA repair protein RadC